jgi:hypothetical protein
MTTRSLPTRKKNRPAKKVPRARPKTKALSTRDPVKKAPAAERSLLDSQLTFLRAVWSMNPVAMALRQQAALFDGLIAGQNVQRKRRKRA